MQHESAIDHRKTFMVNRKFHKRIDREFSIKRLIFT